MAGELRPLDRYIKNQLDSHLSSLKDAFEADVVTIISPILFGLDLHVRDALDSIGKKRKSLVVVLDTQGGVVEVVERMVQYIRSIYKEVIFIIPDRAMSAGTIFALSGDRILMDDFSRLGPIDPQVERDGRLVPALAYLNQVNLLKEKDAKGELTSVDYALISKLDLAELYQFEQAKELSIELLEKWLSTYKFKNWKKTETSKITVTKKMREDRAKKIAELLNKPDRWHSHGRGLDMKTLTSKEIGLKIENYGLEPSASSVKEYFELLKDYMGRGEMRSFVHAEGYF